MLFACLHQTRFAHSVNLVCAYSTDLLPLVNMMIEVSFSTTMELEIIPAGQALPKSIVNFHFFE